MKRIILAALCAGLLSGPVAAQTAAPSASCKAFSAAVDASLKSISLRQAATFAQSAPQATQLATELQNDITFLKINLDLMAANHCPMPTHPVSETMYFLPASECAMAGLKSDPDKATKCDQSTWKANDR